MNIQIYFEFVARPGGLALRINDQIVGLKTEVIEEKKTFYYQLNGYQNSTLKIGLISLGGESIVNVHLVNQDNGGRFSQIWKLDDNRKEVIRVIDIRTLGNEDKEDEQYLEATPPEDRPAYKKPVKKSFKSTLNFNKELSKANPAELKPDYSYYDNQVSREDILTARADESQNTLVEVFYATDRKEKQKKKGRMTYTNSRGDLQLGSCIVSVPANKKKGDLPLPPWYLFGLSSNEDKYIIIREVNPLQAKDFFKRITDKVQSSPEKDAFVFVHGFNVSFTESAMRAAQITTDIGFRGAPIIYSWPSRQSIFGYTADEATATGYSADNIIQLIKDVRTTTGAERVHLIAHSMGNRLLTDALKTLVAEGFNKDFLFNQIILAAPDIDAEVFVKNIAPKIVSCSERVTLYTSQYDKPLWFSDKLHGSIPRSGTSTNVLAVIDGMDTIDASIEKTDFLGHGYFAESRALIDDIFQAVRFNKGPEDRNLRKKTSGTRVYWEFY